MKLITLFGPESHEIWTAKRHKQRSFLDRKFKTLVKKHNLSVYEKEDCMVASDDSGEILFKKVLDYEWFLWSPNKEYEIEEPGEDIKLDFESALVFFMESEKEKLNAVS